MSRTFQFEPRRYLKAAASGAGGNSSLCLFQLIQRTCTVQRHHIVLPPLMTCQGRTSNKLLFASGLIFYQVQLQEYPPTFDGSEDEGVQNNVQISAKGLLVTARKSSINISTCAVAIATKLGGRVFKKDKVCAHKHWQCCPIGCPCSHWEVLHRWLPIRAAQCSCRSLAPPCLALALAWQPATPSHSPAGMIPRNIHQGARLPLPRCACSTSTTKQYTRSGI